MPLNSLTVCHATRTRKFVGASGLILSHASERAIPNIGIIDTLETHASALTTRHWVVAIFRTIPTQKDLGSDVVDWWRCINCTEIRNRPVVNRCIGSLLVTPIGNRTIKTLR